jgi:hypothetical protein
MGPTDILQSYKGPGWLNELGRWIQQLNGPNGLLMGPKKGLYL